jgi:DNA-binding CsgD family transcriptional regulator
MKKISESGLRVIEKLTRREFQICALMETLPTNQDVSESMGIQLQVVKNYMRRIFDKVGVDNRMELYVYLIQHGIISCPCMMPTESLRKAS